MQGLMKFHVVGKERTQTVPVSLVEQGDLAGNGSGCVSHLWQTGKFGQRLVEYVLQDKDTCR